MFHIESVTAYPKDYTETTEVAKNELRAKARPKLIGQVENMKGYDVIFLGYPNWWGTMPMPVYTFLESYDFSGKKIDVPRLPYWRESLSMEPVQHQRNQTYRVGLTD